jgi:uncharacterized OsmC-like protein
MSRRAGKKVVNNIDLGVVRESKASFEADGGHHCVEKVIEGGFRLEGSPSFSAELRSDASAHFVESDEPRVLGGHGVHASPLSYVLFGVLACYANTLAIQCGLNGIELGSLKVRGRLSYDIGPLLTGIHAPLRKELTIEVESDRDLRRVIEVSNERCPALYLVDHAVATSVVQVGSVRSKRSSG